MKKINSPSLIILIILISGSLYSQNNNQWFLMPDGLGFSNQLEYSYNIDNNIEIFENWLNVDYSKNIFTVGIRFEVFQPNDPDPSVSRGKVRYADIAYKYFNVEFGDNEAGKFNGWKFL